MRHWFANKPETTVSLIITFVIKMFVKNFVHFSQSYDIKALLLVSGPFTDASLLYNLVSININLDNQSQSWFHLTATVKLITGATGSSFLLL